MFAEYEANRPFPAAHHAQRAFVDIPVVEVSVDAGTRRQHMHVQLVFDRKRRITNRELLAILRQGAGDRARRAREHLLLTRAQRSLGFADKLASGPRQH